MKVKAVFDSILTKEIEQDDSQYGSIIVPDMGKEKHIVAEIIDVGPGRISALSGEFIPTSSKVGTKILLPQLGITRISFEGEDYIACDETKILAIIE